MERYARVDCGECSGNGTYTWIEGEERRSCDCEYCAGRGYVEPENEEFNDE